MGQSDVTHADELGVLMAGQPFPHLLCHCGMVDSRREHVGGVPGMVPGGESFPAVAENLPQARWSPGGVPQDHRTDSLSAGGRKLPRRFS